MAQRRIGRRKRTRPKERQGPKKTGIGGYRNWAKKQKMITVCGFCGKVRVSGVMKDRSKEVWADIGIKDPGKHEPDLPSFSHTFCSKCSKKHYDI